MPSPAIQRTSTYITPRGLGIIDSANMDQLSAIEQRCFSDQTYDMTRGATTCADTLTYITDVSGGVYSFDGRIFDYDFKPVKQVYEDLLVKSNKVNQLWRAIHIQQGTNHPKFIPSSHDVATSFAPEHLIDYSPYYNYMIKENHPLLVAAGEFDLRDGARGQTIWMQQLLNISSDFWKQDRKVYHYFDQNTKSQAVGGYYRTLGNFSLATLPKSGHFAPHDNYDATKSFLDDFVTRGKLHCHSSSCSVVDKMCSHMNNCSFPQQGECSAYGTCQCKKSEQGNVFRGADCSYQAISGWGAQNLTLKGHAWAYFVFNAEDDASQEWKVTINANASRCNIYGSFGADANPNRYNHNMKFLKIPAGKDFQLTNMQVYSHKYFTLAIEVEGFDEPTTTAHTNILSVNAQKVNDNK